MNPKAETDALNRAPIAIVGDLLGFKLPRRGLVRCPFPDHEDRTPSFHVHPSEVRWRCFGCGRKGGSIDLVMEALTLDFVAAKTWLRQRIDHTGMGTASAPDATQPLQARKVGAGNLELQTDSDVLEFFLKSVPLRESGHDYLQTRSIGAKTAAVFEVGQLETASAIVRRLLDRFGYERLDGSGLLASASAPDNPRLVFAGPSLIFPFRESGKLQYAQARYIGRESSAPRWTNLRGHRHRLYNVDVLSSDAECVAICEGVTDTLSAVELGYQAVGLVGVSARLSEAQIASLRGRTVLILLDWDSPGEARSKELMSELTRSGVASVRLARPDPDVSDLNEFLIRQRAAS